ncbi:MAG TPA: hypothetical protein VMY05_11400 [Acidobacteriota bacterium]|nr:hypothetical protein [Acidobacteriota bacterium]
MSDQNDIKQPIPDIVAEVDGLSEEVKSLALNLALYLAKLKSSTGSEQFVRLEPDFIRLVNGTVRVVQEVAGILNAARNEGKMIYEIPSGRLAKDRIETKLHGILEQCTRVLESLSRAKDMFA